VLEQLKLSVYTWPFFNNKKDPRCAAAAHLWGEIAMKDFVDQLLVCVFITACHRLDDAVADAGD